MRVKLLNSAMMPQEGQYNIMSISQEIFCGYIRKAVEKNILDSFIGYPQNVELIKKWSGVTVPLNRELTTLKDGDLLLIMRLNYRPGAASKGQAVQQDQFSFFIASYSSQMQLKMTFQE